MIRSPIAFSALALLALAHGTAQAAADTAGDEPLLDTVSERLVAAQDELIAIRRDLHRHPEVSGQEKRTAGVVAERLRALGLTVRTGVGGHGVVATLVGGRPGPMVAVRADMDAVFSSAPDPVSFRSERPGVRHICGHDIHTTVALGLAEGLSAVRERLAGTVLFVFQPAEENATGARAMLADGALDPARLGGRRPIAFFALHTTPLEVGQIGSRPGWMLVGRDRVQITIRGDGAEAAIDRLADRVRGLSTLSAAEARQSQAGSFVLANLFGTEADGLVATIMLSDDRRDGVRAALEQAVATERKDGRVVTLNYENGWVPGAYNDPGLEARARRAVRTGLGDEALVPIRGVVPLFSEDFGAFLQDIPGVMVFLGVSNTVKGWVGMPHSPDYVADESSITVGARALAAMVLDVLADPM